MSPSEPQAGGANAADRERQRLNALLFYALVFLLVYLAYRIVRPFLLPLAWAGILALCAQPVHRRLRTRCGPNSAAILSVIAVALLLIVPAAVLVIALAGEAAQAVSALQTTPVRLLENEKILAAWAWVQAHVPMPSLDEIKTRLVEAAARLTRFLAGQAGVFLQATSVFAFKLLITILALFFFLRDARAMGGVIRKILPFEKKLEEKLIAHTRDLVFAGTIATLSVAALQGIAGGAIFAALGLRAPILWGVVMGVCALLPLFGTALVWVPAAIGLFAGGFWIRGTLLLVLGAALIGGIDNFLRPALISGKSSMNGLVVFLSIMGGVSAFGFVGMVLGPVVAAAVISIFRLTSEEEDPLSAE